MKLTIQDIEKILEEFFRRSEMLRMLGAIPYKEYMEGTKVPDGWKLDPMFDYFVPPWLE